MTPFIFHWKNGLLTKHSTGGWMQALVDLDGKYLFPRDAMKDIRLQLKSSRLVIRVHMLVIGENIARCMDHMIMQGDHGKVAYFSDLINTGRAL